MSRALVLSIGVCYHARLQEREPYRRAVAPSFSRPCQLPGGHKRILKEITRWATLAIHYFRSNDFLFAATSDDTNTFNRVVIKVVTPKGDMFTIGCGVSTICSSLSVYVFQWYLEGFLDMNA